jgi:hypothetical protein
MWKNIKSIHEDFFIFVSSTIWKRSCFLISNNARCSILRIERFSISSNVWKVFLNFIVHLQMIEMILEHINIIKIFINQSIMMKILRSRFQIAFEFHYFFISLRISLVENLFMLYIIEIIIFITEIFDFDFFERIFQHHF